MVVQLEFMLKKIKNQNDSSVKKMLEEEILELKILKHIKILVKKFTK